jgi:DNA-binding NtrC family response regulator
MAVPGLRYAARALVDERITPVLIVLDVHDDADATPHRVEQLLDMAPDAPLILIVGVYDRATWEPLRAKAAEWLQRPVSVGEVAEAVERVSGVVGPRAGRPGS